MEEGADEVLNLVREVVRRRVTPLLSLLFTFEILIQYLNETGHLGARMYLQGEVDTRPKDKMLGMGSGPCAWLPETKKCFSTIFLRLD